MKFIKFFCLLSLTVIIASALAQDTIVRTSFFQKYLDQNVQEVSRSTINTSEIPLQVMQGFMQSPFKDLSIREVYKVEDHVVEMPVWIKTIERRSTVNEQKQDAGTLYVLALADNINQNIKTVLSFNYQGKLLNVKKINV